MLFLLAFIELKATHNRAGEITYTHVSGLTYEISVTIFADPNSPAIARREIEIDYGDNTGRDSLVVVQESNVVPGLVRKRVWRVQHNFPGPGNYTISVTDPNRNAGVDNISNSSAVPFYVESRLRIFPIASVVNNSPILQNDPIDDACVGKLFIHNPGAIDPDGDSLAYAISPSFGIGGNIAPGFVYPPASSQISVDPISGDLRWENPSQVGLFNVAILISEYRSGVFLGSVLRDIQIIVYPGCNNNPPTIAINRENCILAGNTFVYPVQGFDPDPQDLVTLSFTGEIFSSVVPNPAAVNYGPIGNTANATVIWNTRCENIRTSPYTMSIKATDNGLDRGSTNLSTFENGTIRVVGPPVQNFDAIAVGKAIQLTWNNSSCADAIGYIIYRRVDSSGFVPSDCQIGVPSSTGYQELIQLNDPSLNSFSDQDVNLVPGLKYCYLMTARYANGGEGYASDETCAKIQKIVPVITKVSVDSTDINSGSIELNWSPPSQIDSNAYPAPYRYILIKGDENNNSSILDSTVSLTDTIYRVEGINTAGEQHHFRVELYSYGNGKELIGSSAWASSVFLALNPLDNRIELNWSASVSWQNDSFVVYRNIPSQNNTYDSIALVNGNAFTDVNLSNGIEYCYRVKSIGKYPLDIVSYPIVNYSQKACEVPKDNEAPCAPEIQLQGDCELNELNLNWTNSSSNCPVNDILYYRIYRAVDKESSYKVLDSVMDAAVTNYTAKLNSVAGCYAVAAVDSSGNESILSAPQCVEYCVFYELPNVFTPNGDGINDLFVPLNTSRLQYVESIDLKIYNRWGELVFETTDPDIKWTGEHQAESTLLKDAVFYYRCVVNEYTLDGIKPRILKGTVTLLDPKPNSFK